MDQTVNLTSKKQQICERLKKARITAGYETAKEFTQEFGIKMPTYHMHESGLRSMSIEVMEQYSSYLTVNSDWILTGQGPMKANMTRQVPIISWNEIESYSANTRSFSYEFTLSDLDLDLNAFALRVEDDSMEPRYPEGSIVIVDPGRQPQNKDFALISLPSQDAYLFKQLVCINGLWYAKSINPSYKAILLKSKPKVIGKITQVKFNF